MKVGKGGMCIAVAKKCNASHFIDVSCSPNPNIFHTRVVFSDTVLGIVLVYAPQESASKEEREEFFKELSIEVHKSVTSGEHPLLLGDFNAKISSNSNVLMQEVTSGCTNGVFLLELIKEYQLTVMNFSEVCEGKWTHEIRTSKKASVLDYVITSKVLEPKINRVLIDEDCLYCPFHITRKHGKEHIQFSDHNAIILEISLPYQKPMQSNPQMSWKLTKKGLADFNKLSSLISYQTTMSEQSNIQQRYDYLENCVNNLMGQCFQKQKMGRKKKHKYHAKEYSRLCKAISEFKKKGQAQRKVALYYHALMLSANSKNVARRRTENMKKTLQSLSDNDKFSPNGFWKIYRNISQSRSNECTSILTSTGTELTGASAIRNAYKDEFSYRLRQRTIDPDLEEFQQRTVALYKMYVAAAGKMNEEPGFTLMEAKNVIRNLKTGKAPGPDMISADILKSSADELLLLIVDMFNAIKCSLEIPDQWHQVVITTIYKLKGSKKLLENHRGIFLTSAISKLFERMIMNRLDAAFENVSIFQAGSRKNRSTADQIFLIKGCIDHAVYVGKTVYITCYDFKQCFDSLWMEDTIISLWKVGVNTEYLALLSKLNDTSNICVKTPVGMTDKFIVKKVVKQGTVSGPRLCSTSTAECCDEHTTAGVTVGSLAIRSLAFVDDIMDLNENIRDVHTSHRIVCNFTKKKRLQMETTKCPILIVNGRVIDAAPVLLINNEEMPVKEMIKYLGDVFNSKGNYNDLIKDRCDKGKGCITNSIALCDNPIFGVYTIECLLMLHQSMFLGSVLFNSQAWSYLTQQNIDQLTTTQLKFLKRILHAPSSTPNAVTFLELGVLPIKFEIQKRQLMFLQHVISLEDSDPVKLMYREQQKYMYEKNWHNCINKIRIDLHIIHSDSDIAQLSKVAWKNIVESALQEAALQELKREYESKNKSMNLKYETLETRKYLKVMNPADARLVFKVRSRTLDCKVDSEFRYKDMICRGCQCALETNVHIVNECNIHGDINQVNVSSEEIDDLKIIAKRIFTFMDIVNCKDES